MSNETSKPLRAKRAAEYIGVCPATLRSYADAGKVPFIRYPSGEKRYRVEDLAAFLNGQGI